MSMLKFANEGKAAGYGSDWQLIGYANSGESESTEYCAHCNKPIWEHEEVQS